MGTKKDLGPLNTAGGGERVSVGSGRWVGPLLSQVESPQTSSSQLPSASALLQLVEEDGVGSISASPWGQEGVEALSQRGP